MIHAHGNRFSASCSEANASRHRCVYMSLVPLSKAFPSPRNGETEVRPTDDTRLRQTQGQKLPFKATTPAKNRSGHSGTQTCWFSAPPMNLPLRGPKPFIPTFPTYRTGKQIHSNIFLRTGLWLDRGSGLARLKLIARILVAATSGHLRESRNSQKTTGPQKRTPDSTSRVDFGSLL